MKGKLTEPQIQYVLYHLGHHAVINKELHACFCFGEESEPGNPFVQFFLSEKELDLTNVIRIDDIPVLYPGAVQPANFYSIKNNNLIFHHDLLKSTFHLLSGYGEFKSGAEDPFGRFPYEESLQRKLGIISLPVVNYYFSIILEGIEQFCTLNGITFEKRDIFKKPVFQLSHDIDRIDAYYFYETVFKFKQLLGLEKSPHSFFTRTKVAFSSLCHFLNPFSRSNPFWTFDFLRKTEADLGITSTYYFLENDQLHMNSRYSFKERRIRKLFHQLDSDHHEIGLHGTIQSSTDQAAMNRTLHHLQEVAPSPVKGIRQHFLKLRIPHTALIQENAGLKYDASLGFAEHEGFRNSYCWPFKLYDFANEKPVDVWEIPLTIMDGTLFFYRKLDFDSMMDSVEILSREILKFNGIFSLLWHNHLFDEQEFPGITDFYTRLLKYFTSLDSESITCTAILKRLPV